MSEKRFVKIHAYDICTPKFLGDSYDKDRYDHEQIEIMLERILKVEEKERAYYSKNNKMINLINVRDSEDQDFIEGTFIYANYGKEQEIIDVFTFTNVGNTEPNHGVKNEVAFILDKRNGLLLIHYDSQAPIGRDILHKFFVKHVDLMDDYKDAFNKINDPIKIMKRSFIKVATLPSKEFFDELDKFKQINEAFVIADLEAGTSNEAIEYMRKEARESDVDDFQEMKITLKNNIKKRGIKNIKAFFERLIEEDKYDGYGVSGIYESGNFKTISLAKVPQAYHVEITFNSNGIPDRSELIKEMINIAKFQNPILNKNAGMVEVKKVGVKLGEEN